MNKRNIAFAADENRMEELLAKIQPVPSEEFHQKMTKAAWRLNQLQQSRTVASKHRLRIAVGFALLLAGITLVASPHGRAFAQSLLQFFTRAEANSFPVQGSEMPLSESDPAAPTAMPPAPLVSLSEAERQAGFDAAELPLVPDGFNYLGARLYGNAINIEYEAQGGGGHLMITQSRESFLQSDWDKVPAEAVIPVRIGDLQAEFAQGTFVVPAGETSAIWNPGAAILRLRWMQDDIWFEMAKFGDVEAIEYLDREGMIELAERLTTDIFPLEIREVEAAAGFDILEPTWIPESLSFDGAAFESSELGEPKQDAVKIFYSFGPRLATNGVVLTQQPLQSVETCDICDLVGNSAQVDTVQINSKSGEYAVGVWKANDAGEWIWTNDPWLQRLRWQDNGIAFELLYMGPPEEITKADLVGIAESLQ